MPCFISKVDSKDAEMKAALNREECRIEAMKQKMKDQEKENQSNVIKLQMEVHTADLFLYRCRGVQLHLHARSPFNFTV